MRLSHPTTGLAPGRDAPLGASLRDGGVNVAVFSEHAEAIELCLFDADGLKETARLRLHGPRDGIFSGFLPGAGPGLIYGLRAHGPHQPAQGHRFNPRKLLLDPTAREIVAPPGGFVWHDALLGYPAGRPEADLGMDPRDSAAWALKARVAPALPLLAAQADPRIDDAEVVLYEVHVRDFTMRLPGLPPALRGTFLGLAHPAALAHFRALGVTTLSLLPVQHHLDEPGLVARGRINHWGYNTIGFFAADPRFATAGPGPTEAAGRAEEVRRSARATTEFRAMVQALHEAGLEVVVDIVFNHTAEGSELGHTLSWRGLDHAAWYRLKPGDRRRCEDFSGCGNTLNAAHPRVLQFVLDALRHWVQVMGVDGFRFDLAPALGRAASGRFKPHAPFFAALLQDPVLARARLIAEPWDLGPDGHRTGGFPGRWLEWNDRFRDDIRRWWLGQGIDRATFARRFCGSADLFHRGRRTPLCSVNFITAHDGFTLVDLSSHDRKHNEANGEDNRDGRDGEPSAAFGAEGPSEDPAIAATRSRVRRALLATLLLAQGTPMMASGDETGHSRGGNNNAYCQDNATGWIDWPGADASMTAFATRVLALRRSHPLLRHDRWFHPRPGRHGEPVLTWHRPDGQAPTVEDWHDGADQALACRIDPGPRADEATPACLWIAFNPGSEPVRFTLPPGRWALRLDTAEGDPADPRPRHPDGDALEATPSPRGAEWDAWLDVSARSLFVLESTTP